ncbi:uncharacterized protein LOC119728107 [Patiria miniata]|uniref:Uncharacterized protein n=1 Tax=Patiria miniata TaxID=46514 RepID=A0A913ZX31_PATMI|nr:uncharacterized protein LOC119728107 [Patiria miniata]
MPKKMEPPPKQQHHPSLADRVTGRAKVVTFYKSGDKNFKGIQIPIRKKYNFGTLLSDLDRVSNFPFGVRRIVTPTARHDVTDLEDFEDGKMYIMAPTKKKPKPLDLGGIQARPPWAHPKSLPGSGANSADSEPLSPRKMQGNYASGNPRNSESRNLTVKKIMVMRNGDPHSKHMILLNRNRIPSFEAFLTDIGESFQLPAQKLFTSDGLKVESLSAIFNGSEELFVVGTGVEKFRPSSYKENSPFKPSSRTRESLRRKSMDESDQPPQKIIKKSRGKFRVWVATSESPAAGTDAVVSITVYGDKGKSDDIVLGCGNGRFESANEDEFNINVGNIGDIYKIRIGHDDSTEFSGWLCEEVRLQDVHTGDEIVFPCSRWMSRQEDDGQTCRELPVIVEGSPVFPIVNYYVAVVTGNYWNAGTAAKVYVTVYGERGDTGPRLLHKTKRTKKFDKGKTDVFNIEAVSLGMLKKILIGHDSTEPEDGWFLEKVIIKDHKGSSLESVFPCHSWLDATLEEDGKTSKEIYVNNKQTNLEKEMWEQEKWKFKPGNQLVFISKGSGKAIQIKADGSIEAAADPYNIQKTAIFEVQKMKANVHVVTNVANPDHSIAMDSNKISGKGKGNELKLRIQPDRSIVMETAKNSSQLLTFGQTGKPGDVRGPSLGPTRQFYCYVKGMFRDEGIVMFYTSRIQTLTVTSDGVLLATGQRSEDAYWRVHKVGESGSVRMFESLAQPESFLRIKDGHCDVQGSGDDYCHFKVLRVKEKGYVSLQSVASGDVCVGFVPYGSVKPTVDTGEDNVRLHPHVIQFGTKKQVTTPTPPTSAKPAVNRKKRVLNKQPGNNPKKAAALPLTPTPTPSPPVREKSVYDDGDWKVWVKTGKVATKASVVLVVYGEDGVSQPFTLGKGGKELFKAGEENEFKVNVLSVGDIYKIRIGLDTTSKKTAWKLDQVKMKDMITDEQLLFKFKNRWLSPHEDDADVWRESPAVRPGSKPLSIHKYSIQVTTGYEVGSSTDANVYLCLFGEKGDTGKRQLIKSNHQEKFQESQTDMFEMEAVTVMTPTKVIVGHDGKGPGAGWYLGEVIIKESKTSKTEYVFPCNRWLDEGQDDKLIERELELGEVREIQPHEWQVYVTTGSDGSAGTTAMVTLVAYGDKDKTEVALIPKGENGFQAGTTQDFRVYLGDIGQLYKIRIGHDNAAQEASWYLKTVRMLDLNESTEVEFAFDRWLSEKHDDLDVWRELPAVVTGKKPLPVTRYYIQVYTGSEENSKTDASVYLQLWGKNGDSGKRHLVRSKNNKDKKFLAGQMDVFEIEAVYLGRLLKVTVGHDGKDPGQGWLLEKVVVKESKNAKNETLFPCKKWLDAGQDDQKIERDLTPAKPTSAPNPVTSESAASKTDSITVSWKQPTSGKVTGYRVTCDPPDAPASEVIIADAKTTKAEFGGLTAGKAYQFEIVTTNGELESDKVTLKTNAKPSPVLDAILDSTADTIVASWTHPQGELSGYKLRLTPPDAKKSSLRIKDPSKTRAEFTGLTPAKKYKVDITTISGELESEKVTVQETTKMPEIRVLKVPSAETTKTTSDSLTVSWTKPEGDVTGYRLTILPAEGASPDIKIDSADKTTAEFKGLSSGQEYTVEVYTVYKDRESEKMTLTARTDAKSNQPKDPMATSTLTAISVSWTKPEGQVTGYRVLCTPADAETSEIKLDDGDTTAAEFSGLTPGRKYEIEIYAQNGEVQSDKTTISQTTKPNGVLDASVESSSTDTVNLAWTRPEGDLTGYRIDYRPVSNQEAGTQPEDHPVDKPVEEQNKPVDGQDKPVDQDNLVNGQDKPVDEQNKLVNEQDKPDNDQAKPVNEESILVDGQDKPVDEQDKPANDQDAEVETKTIDSSDATKAEVTGLTPGQSYRFSIITVSSQEESEPVTVNCTTKPVPVQEATVQPTDTSLAVSWIPPEGAVYTAYKITCTLQDSSLDDNNAAEIRVVNDQKADVTFSGLVPETEYVVQVIAVAGTVESESLAKSATTTAASEEQAPEIPPSEDNEVLPATPNKVLDAAATGTNDSIHISWRNPEGPITGFKVVCKSTDPDTELVKIVDSGKTKASFSGLNAASAYALEVYTLNETIESEAVSTETMTTETMTTAVEQGEEGKEAEKVQQEETEDEEKPNPVLDATLSDITDSSLVVSWKKPDGPITGFKVECKNTSDQSETRILDREKTSVKFSELDAGTEYTVDVFSLNKCIESEAVMLTGKTTAQADAVEEKPQPVLNAKSESLQSVLTLSWERPTEGPVTGYRVALYSPSCPDDPEIRVVGSDKTSVTFSSLEVETTYTAKIATLSGDSLSEEVTIEGTTLPAAEQEQPQQVLEAACETTSNSLKVSWKRPAWPVTGYKISLSPKDDQDDPEIRILDSEKTSVEFGSLLSGREYLVGILTLDGQRESAVVQVEGTTEESGKPLPVLDPETNATTDSVTVQWSHPDCQRTGYRVVCRLKSPDSQNATGGSEDSPANEKPEETDETKMDTQAPSDHGNEASHGDETAPSSDEKSANEKPGETEKSKLDEPTPSGPSNKAPPGDETAPSSDEKSPTDSSQPTEGDKHIVEEKKVEADVTEVEFTGLTQMTEYAFDIYTVSNDVESEAATVDDKTKKVKLPTQGEWKLWMTTGDDSKPAHNARVHIVVYGDKDKTAPIMLTEEDEHSYFQASNTDEFKINVGDIGDIYKIRIGHDDDIEWEGWHLKQVKMVDQHSEEELVFDYDRWMSRREDDFDIVRELPAVREDQETLPVNVYHVCVSTGDHWAAYTDAKMWVTLHGERGDTGKRVLYHSLKHPIKYMKGQMDEFKVEAVSLGKVSMVEIGHDGVGYGAGIFINSVSVRESETADKEYLFACNSWLDDHMEDRQTNKQLQLLGIRPIAAENKEEPSQDAADTNWKALIQTSDLESAGTTANVYLTVFGETGRSQSHILQGQTLDANTEQEFEVDIGEIGEITKIRLDHDDSGASPAWHVQQVRLVHPTKPELVFRVNAWLSSDQGDNPSTIREVAAIRPGADPLPVVTYTVQVYIKEDPDSASTNPSLYIALIGEAGEMAKRELIRTGKPVSEDGKVKVDTVSFEAISVGWLQQAVLSISSDEKQDTWFAEKVTVQEGKYATTRSVFPCKMWFGNAIIGEDGNTVLQTDLQPEGTPVLEQHLTIEGEEAVPKDNKEAENEDDGESASKGNWTIWITPGKEDGMGSNSGLSVQVYGEKGRSEVIPLQPQGVYKEAKEGEGEEEKVDEEKKEGAEEPAEEGETASREPEAETEKAEEKGDGEQDLSFPAGSTNDFDINVGEIGPIYKIRLLLEAGDEKDETPSIFLDKIKMKDKDTDQEFHFFVDRWLRRSEDVKLPTSAPSPPDAQPEPEAKQEQKNDKKAKDKKPEDKAKSSKAGKTRSKKDEKGKAEGKRNKSKIAEEDDEKAKEPEAKDAVQEKPEEKTQEGKTGQTEEEVADCYLELPAIRPDIPPLPVYKYELLVRTGDKGAASLSDVIYATVYGERGDMGCRILRKSNNQVMFHQGQVDVFTMEAVDILRPTSITMGHHSEGHGAGWYLDTVTLKQSAQATTQYVFPCKRWMDTGVDDRKLERTLPLLGEVECPEPATSDTRGHWQVKVQTSDKPDAGTTAKACLVVYGDKGQCSTHQLERETFQPGTEEEFEISVGDIGPVSKIRLEHDNSGDSPAWHVNSVTMKDLDTNEELDFKMDRWLARDEDDGQICHEVPAVREGKDSLQVYSYQVKVHTGDRDNATTEGAIHMTLHGSRGDSGQRLLVTSNNSQKFAKGQIDTFTIQAVDLGKVHTISVRNDSLEPSQAWYLEKAAVKTSPTAEQEFVFPASRWIGQADAESEELRTAENNVELLVQEKWKCTVHTSDLPDCGTDANVLLVAYGNAGMSKVMPLTNGQEGNFQPGKSAEFELEPGSYIGNIYKIRVELDDGKDKSWHLKQVDLQDCFSDESLTFEYSGWLSRSQNDGTGDIVADLPALRPDEEPLPVVKYNLQVLTGEAEDAGTDSEVSVTLFGERGDSGRRLLNKPREGEKAFDEPKKTDVFEIDAVSLGNVSRVLIHKAAGKPWFLDRLILKEGEFANTETEFKHDGWLGDKDQPDQPVDIELVPTTERPSHTVAPLPEGQEPVQSKGNWKVFVSTGDTDTAGTEATVTMTVYGSEGISKPLPLQKDDQPTVMEPGQTQEFEVNVGEVGHIYKVRLEHDGTNEESDWFLEKFKMKDVDTKAEFSYTLSRWLSKNQEGCDRVVEIPAVWPETPIPQVVKYEVQILTGGEDGADAQANVYLTLKGEHGDTGRRDMVRDPGDPTMFSKGHEDRFTIEAVSLGKIDKCIVGHDGDKPDSGWFLDKIVVSESGENPQETTFLCSRWLAVDKGDNTTEVELDALPPSEGAVDSSAEADAGKDQEEGKTDEGKDEEGKENDDKTQDGQEEDKKDDKKDDQ